MARGCDIGMEMGCDMGRARGCDMGAAGPEWQGDVTWGLWNRDAEGMCGDGEGATGRGFARGLCSGGCRDGGLWGVCALCGLRCACARLGSCAHACLSACAAGWAHWGGRCAGAGCAQVCGFCSTPWPPWQLALSPQRGAHPWPCGWAGARTARSSSCSCTHMEKSSYKHGLA